MQSPLDSKPFDVHISPFMSFPKGLSVYDGVLKDTYLGTNFQMHYPSVDSIIRILN